MTSLIIFIVIVAVIALYCGIRLIVENRRSQKTYQEDVPQFEPDRSKDTLEMPVMDEKAKYYKRTGAGGHFPMPQLGKDVEDKE